jgi:hypothetical protein
MCDIHSVIDAAVEEQRLLAEASASSDPGRRAMARSAQELTSRWYELDRLARQRPLTSAEEAERQATFERAYISTAWLTRHKERPQ